MKTLFGFVMLVAACRTAPLPLTTGDLGPDLGATPIDFAQSIDFTSAAIDLASQDACAPTSLGRYLELPNSSTFMARYFIAIRADVACPVTV